MIVFLYFLIGILWLVRIGVNLLSYINLWWVKEYRFDRMLIHLRTAQGRRILFPAWKRPPLTPKAVGLVVFTGLSQVALFYVLSSPVWVRLVIIDVTTFPLTWLWVGLFKLPTLIYHQIIITLAISRLRRHRPMVVVGITGSYGKTSTKEYLATILESRYRVLKTAASKNSPIGIAEVILGQLRPDHEIFIVEMGAYKQGEIARMSQIVKPQIGIITAINAQHQDLFLTLENTKRAKYELIAGLSGREIAIFNADSVHTRQMGEWARRDGRQVWWWSRKKIQNLKLKVKNDNFFQAENVKADLQGASFTCTLGQEAVAVKARVLGEHQVDNILAAIAGAMACGMTLSQAARAAASIKPAKHVMELSKGINGSTFIDDTFNNNPDAAMAALSFLAKNKGKKTLVFQPMIELGSYASISHREVGEKAGKICDRIILTNANWQDDFIRGVRSASELIPVEVLSPQRAVTLIQSFAAQGDMVLFKGKEAASVLHLLQRH